MIILINCSNLRFGGAKTVGMNIINYFKKTATARNNKIVIVVPTNAGYEQFAGEGITIEEISPFYNKPWGKPLLNFKKLPSLEKKHKPDLVLSLGNIAFPSKAPQLLLIHIPYPVYPESIVWKRLSIRYWLYLRSMVRLIERNLKFANYIFVQTETMKDRLAKYQHIEKQDIFILPNSVSFTSQSNNKGQIVTRTDGKIKLLLLSKLYPHKNFDILLPVGEAIKKAGLPIEISITINPKDNPESKKFLDELTTRRLNDVIVNLGHINFDKIADAYHEHDGLFLPTLLESFTGTYIEAMHFNKPIFTSDLDFAREICKDAAYYFDPLNANAIITAITEAFKDKPTMERKVEEGKAICNAYKSWDELGMELEQFISTRAGAQSEKV